MQPCEWYLLRLSAITIRIQTTKIGSTPSKFQKTDLGGILLGFVGPESTSEHPWLWESRGFSNPRFRRDYDSTSWITATNYSTEEMLRPLAPWWDHGTVAALHQCWWNCLELLELLALQPKAESSRGSQGRWRLRREGIPCELSLHGIFLFLPCNMGSFGTLQRIFSTAKMTEFTRIAFVTTIILEWKETAGDAAAQFMHLLHCKSWNGNCLWDWYTKSSITVFPLTRCHCSHTHCSHCSHYLTHTGLSVGG